jgi:hypothetical protein
MTTTDLALVPICGTPILSLRIDGIVYVPMKQVCDALELPWEAQRQRIQSSEIMSEGTLITQVSSGGGLQEQLCLPLKLARVFLLTIPAERIRNADARARVLAWQKESFGAVDDYWTRGFAANPRAGARSALDVRGALRLLAAMREEDSPSARAMLHAMLVRMGEESGFAVPPIDEICSGDAAATRFADTIALFWARVDALDGAPGEPPINQHRVPGMVAINLFELERRCAARRLSLPPRSELRAALRHSRSPRFVAIKPVNGTSHKTVNCWVFQHAEPAQGALFATERA